MYVPKGTVYLKEQLNKNAKIHIIGVTVCFPCILFNGHLWIQLVALVVLLHNLYCVMIQRYNLLRINFLLTKRKKRLKQKNWA